MRGAWIGFLIVVLALFACKKNGPLRLATTSPSSPGALDGGTEAGADAGADATAPKASHTQVNADTFTIQCSASMADCYEHAASVCPSGFDVLTASDPSAAAPDAGTSKDAGAAVATPAAPDAGVAPAAAPFRGELAVRCKAAAAPVPTAASAAPPSKKPPRRSLAPDTNALP